MGRSTRNRWRFKYGIVGDLRRWWVGLVVEEVLGSDGGGEAWWWGGLVAAKMIGGGGSGRINILNPKDIIKLLNGEQLWTNILTLSQVSLGILGGRPGASTYLIGVQEDKVFYLDPHEVQQQVKRYPSHETIKDVTKWTKSSRILLMALSFTSFLIAVPKCESFDTYPRTYDLLHAAGLYSIEQKRLRTELELGREAFMHTGLYDMTMLRFEADQRVGFREYKRVDVTRSYFFSLDSTRDLFLRVGFIEVELEYCCVKSVNRRRQTGQAFRLDAAKQKAAEVEADGSDDLDFGLNILAIGKAGVGKSATINSIFGEDKTSISAFQPATGSVKEISGMVGGVPIRVFDIRVQSSTIGAWKITTSLGLAIWKSVIVTLTHGRSTPPEGSNELTLSYEMFVTQRSHVVQQAISQAVGDMRMMSPSLMNPVSLVENHQSCRKNRDGQKVLPNGQTWRPQLLLLCYSMKILNEANSLQKPQEPFDSRKLFGFRVRSPPLPYMLSLMLQSRPHPKLSNDQDGADSDADLADLTDSDNEEDEDEYDQLPPFKPLKKPFSTSMITGLLSVETTDRHRPGLFVDLVKIVTDISVAVESGEFDTEISHGVLGGSRVVELTGPADPRIVWLSNI
ncbi:translocase of chloroplast 159, chloroplastic [Tanacetum coccineum]